GDDDVAAAELRERAQHGADVGALHVDRERARAGPDEPDRLHRGGLLGERRGTRRDHPDTRHQDEARQGLSDSHHLSPFFRVRGTVTVSVCPSTVMLIITASRLRPSTKPFITLSPGRRTKLLPRPSSTSANLSASPHTMPTTLRPPTSGGASPPTSTPTNSPTTRGWKGVARAS